MKIALVCHHYTLEKGGKEKYTVFLSRALARKGHEVHVFSNTRMEDPHIVFHHVPILRLSSPVKHLTFSQSLRNRFRREQFDIVHSMERTFYQDIFRVSDGINPIQMRQRYPNPTVRFFKKISFRRQVLTRLERRIFEQGGCRAIMANSKLVCRQIVEHYSPPPEKLAVIYNGIDTDRFNPGVKNVFRVPQRKALGLRSDQTAVLFVSNDFKLKRLDLVLRALALLGDSSFRLLIAGSDDPSPYRKWIGKNGLGNSVAFLGPRKKIEELYAAADVFVLPTLYDAFANVCLEAMACALPVLTSENNGAAELVENGSQGYVLETSDPGELAGRLDFLKQSSEREPMGQRAARTASAFSREKHLSEVLNLYERVRSSKHVRP